MPVLAERRPLAPPERRELLPTLLRRAASLYGVAVSERRCGESDASTAVVSLSGPAWRVRALTGSFYHAPADREEAAAARVDQLEHDLAEALAGAARLRSELARARAGAAL